jgi:hypothetical protein
MSAAWSQLACGECAFFRANDKGEGLTRIEQHQYPFVGFRPLKVGHVSKLYWKGDPELPGQYAKPGERVSFVIAIQDWMTGQDYQQLRSFVAQAGFELELTAEGRETVAIDGKAPCGNASSGMGSFRGFMCV